MLRIRKVYNLKIVVLAIGILLYLTGVSYPYVFLNDNLRLQIGQEDDTLNRLNETAERIVQLDALWENTLQKSTDPQRLSDRRAVIEALLRLDKEIHGRFRYILAQLVVEDLAQLLTGIRKVWLFGSVDIADVGPGSDIDLVIEVGLEADKQKVYEYFDFFNSQITAKYNKIMKESGISLSELVDVNEKVFVPEEIKKGEGFAAVTKSLYTPASLLYFIVTGDAVKYSAPLRKQGINETVKFTERSRNQI